MDYLYQTFRQDSVLNIFCDASTNGTGSDLKVCYGAVAVVMDNVIDSTYRINTHSTSVQAEAMAVSMGIALAIKYKHKYPIINIFSDSQITIYNLRDRIYNWRCDGEGTLYSKSNTPAANQTIYIMIVNVICYYNLSVNFFHQKGHVNCGKLKELNHALNVFSNSNGVAASTCLAFGRYISKYNNMVDVHSRVILNRNQNFYKETIHPFEFKANPQLLEEYKNKIIKETKDEE